MTWISSRAAMILLVCLIPVSSRCGDHRYISPGVKLGYTFGEGGGFTYGVELSFVEWKNEEVAYGIVLGLDICRNWTKFHIGGEYGTVVGLDVGPTIIWDRVENNTDVGFTLTAYIGAAIPYGYYSLTGRFNDRPLISELGGLLKAPISVGDPWDLSP